MTTDDKPLINVKMYQREPHRVCASVKLSASGKAVGYFVEEEVHPSFVKQIGQDLYELLISNLNWRGAVHPERSHEGDRRFAILVTTFGTNPHEESYYISFVDTPTFSAIGDRLAQLFKDVRAQIITVKMYQSEPHCVCASALINSDGEAFGYFIEEDAPPPFKLKVRNELFELITSCLRSFRKIDPNVLYESNTWFAFILVTYDINPRTDTYVISFSEAVSFTAICDQLVQVFKDGRDSTGK